MTTLCRWWLYRPWTVTGRFLILMSVCRWMLHRAFRWLPGGTGVESYDAFAAYVEALTQLRRSQVNGR